MADTAAVQSLLVRIRNTVTGHVRFVVLDHPDMLKGVCEYLARPNQPIHEIASVHLDPSPDKRPPWVESCEHPSALTDEEARDFFRELTREALAQQRRQWAEYCDAMVALIDADKIERASSRAAFMAIAKSIRESKP